MQIELVGCTSAGKSTLASAIIHKCRELGFDAVLDQEFVLAQFHLNWIHNQQLRKVMMNLFGLAASLATWRRNRAFYRFAIDQLLHATAGPIPRLERIHLLRNVLKRIGIAEIIRRYAGANVPGRHRRIVLVDEGAIQTAHNLFVHLAHRGLEAQAEPATDGPALTEDTASALSTFATLVPLPDVIIYVRQSEELLIQRTMKRGHRRVGHGSYGEIMHFVRQAVSVFDNLMQHPLVAGKVLVVETRVRTNSARNGHRVAPDSTPPRPGSEQATGSTGASTDHVA